MLKTALRWVFVLGVLLFVGPVLSHFMGAIRDIAGSEEVTFLANATLLRGVAMALLTFVLAGVIAIVGTWAFTLGTGLACAGILMAWAAWGHGTTEGILRLAAGNGPLVTLAVEGFLAVTAAAVIVAGATVVNQRRQPAEYAGRFNGTGMRSLIILHSDDDERREKWLAAAGASVFAAGLAAGLLSWLLSVNPLKGQVIFAALVASIGAGFAATYVSARFRMLTSPALAIVGVALAALFVPLVARVLHGPQLIEAMYAGKLFAGARIGPTDWAAGALLGVPVGVSWAGAVIDARSIEVHGTPPAATV
jgi:hypothetical protein